MQSNCGGICRSIVPVADRDMQDASIENALARNSTSSAARIASPIENSLGIEECDLIQLRKKFGKANVTSLVERVSRFAIVLRNNDRQSRRSWMAEAPQAGALPVLERPEIPLHTNALGERSARPCHQAEDLGRHRQSQRPASA